MSVGDKLPPGVEPAAALRPPPSRKVAKVKKCVLGVWQVFPRFAFFLSFARGGCSACLKGHAVRGLSRNRAKCGMPPSNRTRRPNSVAKGSGSDLKAGSQVGIQAKSGQSGDLVATHIVSFDPGSNRPAKVVPHAPLACHS